jgi:hypothetical protein
MTQTIRQNLPDEIPPELNRWNWGAFLLTWIWGVGNGVFISLLVFIPFLGFLIMPFVLGAKGNAWAWKTRRWDSAEHFRNVQRRWAFWAVVIWIGCIALVGAMFGGVFFSLTNSEAYKLALAKLQSNSDVVAALGEPITGGISSGSLNIVNDSGSARLEFSVTGPKGAGRATLEATKKAGVWTLNKLRVTVDGSSQSIDVIGGDGALLAPALRPRGSGEYATSTPADESLIMAA